jgi:hypothetical protein
MRHRIEMSEELRKEFIKDYPDKGIKYLHQKYNLKKSQVCSLARHYGLFKSEEYKKEHSAMKRIEGRLDEFLAAYPHTNEIELKEVFGLSPTQQYNIAWSNNVHKTSEYLSRNAKRFKNGVETRFKKGHKPFNKGLKWEDYIPQEHQSSIRANFFTSDRRPVDKKYDGFISNWDGYLYIRISRGKWKLYSWYVWEKVNGKVPKGYNIIYKDGNPLNCELSNLEMLSNAELMAHNNDYPIEIKQLYQLRGALKRQINKYKNQQQNGND